MRATASRNGLTLTAYAGTTGVHLAWDADEELREGLLGFAIRRYDQRYPSGVWLKGGIGFPGQQHAPGYFLDTSLAPIQAFRWGDYTVYPGQDYRYTVYPMYGPWDDLDRGLSVSVRVTTERAEGTPYGVSFNRAVAASQAYERYFGATDPHDSAEAQRWLSRGLDTFIVDFIGRAEDASWSLDVMVYEYELDVLRDALKAARSRGVDLRIVYHSRSGDEQTTVNQEHLDEDGLDTVARPRRTSKIFHEKIAILGKVDGASREPVAVLTGSTNWTFNGLYYQANVAHTVEAPAVAGRYAEAFELLWSGADMGSMREWNNASTPTGITPAASTSGDAETPELIFSPRSYRTDLERYISLVGGAQRSLLFVTAFDLNDDLEEALSGERGPRILRYGLQNSASKITGYDRTHARSFTATGRLRTAPAGFLQEHPHGQQGNILVHTKTILVDFDTAHPALITGSANFSYSSSYWNDENVLVIRDDTRVADIYLCEMLRLFDHYRFRYNWSNPATPAPPPSADTTSTSGTVTRRAELDPTDAWTGRYFDDPLDPRVLERHNLARPLR